MKKSIYNMIAMLLNDAIPERKNISTMSTEEKESTVAEITNFYKNTDLFNFLSESENNDWRVGLTEPKQDEANTVLYVKAYLHDATTNTLKEMVVDLATGQEIQR